MPYYRRRNYGRRSFRKKTYRKRPSSFMSKAGQYAQMAYSAYKGVRYLKGLVNAEVKKFDLQLSAGNITDAGNVISVNAIAQGDNQEQRDGISIFVKSFDLNGVLRYNSSGDTVQVVRIAIIEDTQQVGDTLPVLNDIYSAPGTSQVAPLTHLNPLTVGRFKVLWSKLYTLDAEHDVKTIKINLPMRHHVRFNGSAGTDYQRGGLMIVACSSQGTTNYPVLDYTSRTSFHDN